MDARREALGAPPAHQAETVAHRELPRAFYLDPIGGARRRRRFRSRAWSRAVGRRRDHRSQRQSAVRMRAIVSFHAAILTRLRASRLRAGPLHAKTVWPTPASKAQQLCRKGFPMRLCGSRPSTGFRAGVVGVFLSGRRVTAPKTADPVAPTSPPRFSSRSGRSRFDFKRSPDSVCWRPDTRGASSTKTEIEGQGKRCGAHHDETRAC